MTLYVSRVPVSECTKLRSLLDRYRDLLATAKDEMLRRGIMSQITSLEAKLRACSEEPEAPTPARALLQRARALTSCD